MTSKAYVYLTQREMSTFKVCDFINVHSNNVNRHNLIFKYSIIKSCFQILYFFIFNHTFSL